jgi:hypothetical protein
MQETLDVDALMKLAAQAARRNDPAEAADLLRRVLAIQEQTHGPDDVELAPTYSNLAMMLERMGENQRAERCYRRAYGIARRAVGPDDPLTQAARGNLVEFLHATGQLDPLRDDVGDEDAISAAPGAARAADDGTPRLSQGSAEPTPSPPAPAPAAPLPETTVATSAAAPPPATPWAPAPRPPASRPPAQPPARPPAAAAARAKEKRPAPPVPPPPTAVAPPARRSLIPLWVVAGLAAAGLTGWLLFGIADREPLTRSEETSAASPAPAETSPNPAPQTEPPTSESPANRPPRAASSPPAAPPASREAASPPVARAEKPSPAASGQAGALTADTSLCQTLSRGGAWRCSPFQEEGRANGVYYYTRVKSARDVTVRHRWTYEGKTVQTVNLQIRANARDGFRTVSHQRVAARPGQWQVELLAADGTVVDARRFTVAR